MFSSVNIDFAGPCVERNSWTGGETVLGELILTSPKPILTRSITVTLYGREKTVVETTEFGMSVNMAGHISPEVKTQKFEDKRVLLKRTTTLLGVGPGHTDGAPIQQLNGASRLPFAFTLPPILPGVVSIGTGIFSASCGSVHYSLEARIDSPSKLSFTDTTKSINLSIRGNAMSAVAVNRLLMPLPLSTPNRTEGHKTFLLNEGRLSAVCSLPARAIVSGRISTLHIDVKNNTTVALEAIRVHANSRVKLVAEGHAKERSGPSTLLAVLSAVSGPSVCRTAVVGANQHSSCDLQIMIPETVLTSHTSPRLSSSHFIDVELVPKGWLHLPLVLQLPVYIFSPPVNESKVATVTSSAAADSTQSNTASDDDVRSALAALGGLITSTTAKGHTALHLACLRSQSSLCRLLIAAGCDVEAVTDAGFTPLHSAAFGGDADTCIAIMEGAVSGRLGPKGQTGGLARLERLRSAQTTKRSTAESLARAEIEGHKAALPQLAELIATWMPSPPLAAGGGSMDSGVKASIVGDSEDAEMGAEQGVDCVDAIQPLPQLEGNFRTSFGRGGSFGRGSFGSPSSGRKVQPRIITWVPDHASDSCMSCKELFHFLWRRRHHCRSCGILVCYACGPPRPSKFIASAERACGSCCLDEKPVATPATAPTPATPTHEAHTTEPGQSLSLATSESPAESMVPFQVRQNAPHNISMVQDAASKSASVPFVTLECVYDSGANVRKVPSKSSEFVGVIDLGQRMPSTGKISVDDFIYIELCITPQHPQGGWVPIYRFDRLIVKQVPDASEVLVAHDLKEVLRFRCVQEQGAQMLQDAKMAAPVVANISYGEQITATGEVLVDEGSGLRFLQVHSSPVHPQGGWVLLSSSSGKVLMEHCEIN